MSLKFFWLRNILAFVNFNKNTKNQSKLVSLLEAPVKCTGLGKSVETP